MATCGLDSALLLRRRTPSHAKRQAAVARPRTCGFGAWADSKRARRCSIWRSARSRSSSARRSATCLCKAANFWSRSRSSSARASPNVLSRRWTSRPTQSAHEREPEARGRTEATGDDVARTLRPGFAPRRPCDAATALSSTGAGAYRASRCGHDARACVTCRHCAPAAARARRTAAPWRHSRRPNPAARPTTAYCPRAETGAVCHS
jgi:hypothetical protein